MNFGRSKEKDQFLALEAVDKQVNDKTTKHAKNYIYEEYLAKINTTLGILPK
jgi:hypothetical protein